MNIAKVDIIKEVVVIPDDTYTDIDTGTDSQSGSARISSFLAPIV